MGIGEGGIQVDDGGSGVDEEDATDFGSGTEQVGRGLVEIEGDEGAKEFFGALLASGGERDAGRFGAQRPVFIVSDEESYSLSGSSDGRGQGAGIGGGDGRGGCRLAHV